MNLVLTISIGNEYKELEKITHPIIKKYANKIGADFHCINEVAMSKTTPHWEKFQIYHFFDKYDRIIYIDTDIIIREDCPNLFDIVPETHLGMFNEGQFTERGLDLMVDICKAYDVHLPDWNGKYYNTGVMVISKHHRSIFKKPEKEINNFFEQSYINMIIAKRETDMFDMEHKFNRMTCMDRFTGEERFASYIIHYAGWYWKASEIGAISNTDYVIKLIKDDLSKWEKDSPEYKYQRHIYVSVSGGIGDQICAEPAIRWMKENLYPEDEMIIGTHHPTFFKHIDGVEVCEHGKINFKADVPYFKTESLPNPDTLTWSIVSHLLCHTVDYSSIALMKRTLPFKDKTIKFVVKEEDYIGLYDKLGFNNVEDYFVVHPGRHWESKTFPVEYWQSIIDGLGEKVIVIGKTEPGDPPFYKAGARGTVDVDTSKLIDLRDKISINELAALLSKAKCLISNDSFPIHLAGAFDNEIVLLPSCKHPDHILPYRNGNIQYKTKALYKRLIIDDIESRPTQQYPTTADITDINWDYYLLEPNYVLQKII